DPLANTWTATGSLAAVRRNHVATLLPSGRVLVTGGHGPGTLAVATTEIYDPASGTFSAGDPMIGARWQHVALLLSGGRVLVAGGRGAGAGPALASAELYVVCGDGVLAAGE